MSARAQDRKVVQLENDVAAIYELVSKLERGQRRHDARFNAIDGRLDGIDGRLDGIDGRLDEHDQRFDRIDGQLVVLVQGMATVIDLVSRRSADDRASSDAAQPADRTVGDQPGSGAAGPGGS